MGRGTAAAHRVALATGILLAASVGTALGVEGKTDVKYPVGKSTQAFGGHTFDLLVPEGAPPARKFSLLLTMEMDLDSIRMAEVLAKDGFVQCVPRPKQPGAGKWATSEAEDLVELVHHLAAALPVARDRVHVLKNGDSLGFATFVAFDKDCEASSLCLVNTGTYRGKSPPDSARKRLAVLSLWGDPPSPYGDGSDVVAKLTGKVRTVEHRKETPADPYFRYWLHVADDRFEPGRDLSFAWLFDAPVPAAKPRPGERPAPPPPSALDRAREVAAAGKRGALVYFWSATDAAKPEAKALQNELFFRPDVRELAGRLVPVRIERERSEKDFGALGFKTTPAVAVLDATFALVKALEGPIEAKPLLDAMRRVAAPAPREK